MVEYNKVDVKLSDSQSNKLTSKRSNFKNEYQNV